MWNTILGLNNKNETPGDAQPLGSRRRVLLRFVCHFTLHVYNHVILVIKSLNTFSSRFLCFENYVIEFKLKPETSKFQSFARFRPHRTPNKNSI